MHINILIYIFPRETRGPLECLGLVRFLVGLSNKYLGRHCELGFSEFITIVQNHVNFLGYLAYTLAMPITNLFFFTR